MAQFENSIEAVKGDREWSLLERALLDACRAGKKEAGQHVLPKIGDKDTRVRPGLITYLLRGGRPHEDGARPPATGVALNGAWIDGELDFEGQHSAIDLWLYRCRLPQGATFMDASLRGLGLIGCKVQEGLNLHRIRVENSILLRNKTHVEGLTDLSSAEIGQGLDCDDGAFENPNGLALNGDAAKIGANVRLSDEFQAKGEVNLRGANIGGQLACSGGVVENTGAIALNCDAAKIGADVFLSDGFQAKGEVNFIRAHIIGNLVIQTATLNGRLVLQDARIDHALEFLQVTGEIPVLYLTHTKLGELVDDQESWRCVEEALLSGLTYTRILSDIALPDRLGIWEKSVQRDLPHQIDEDRLGRIPKAYHRLLRFCGGRTAHQEDYDPQPLTQLSKVLEAQGQRTDAATVRYTRDHNVSKAEWRRGHAARHATWKGRWASLVQWPKGFGRLLFGNMFGYGHKPGRALYWVAGIVAFAACLYGAAYSAKMMAPNSDVILSSGLWQAILDGSIRAEAMKLDAVAGSAWARVQDGLPVCADVISKSCVAPLALWDETRVSVDYETFKPVLYAIDLFIPLDALGQETTWAPAKDRGALGWWAFYARMPIQMAGWIVTAVGAAALTGLIGRKE